MTTIEQLQTETIKALRAENAQEREKLKKLEASSNELAEAYNVQERILSDHQNENQLNIQSRVKFKAEIEALEAIQKKLQKELDTAGSRIETQYFHIKRLHAENEALSQKLNAQAEIKRETPHDSFHKSIYDHGYADGQLDECRSRITELEAQVGR